MRAAAKLLAEAGLDGEGRRAAQRRRASRSRFEILLVSGQNEAVANIFVDALRQLGITARVKLVDQAQYNAAQERLRLRHDRQHLEHVAVARATSRRSTGAAAGVTEPGTRNYMGVDSPAAEAMIADMLATRDPAEFVAAVQALDRVLTTGRYVIPFWFADESYIAHKADLQLSRDSCRSTATGSAGCPRSGGRRRIDRRGWRR